MLMIIEPTVAEVVDQAMVLGTGLLIGIAFGASLGGWWLLAGIVLAGTASVAATLAGIVPLPMLRVITMLALSALAAATFAAYLAPGQSVLAVVLLVTLATAAVSFGVTVSQRSRAILGGVLLGAAVAFTAACFAISPPGGLQPLVLAEWHPVSGTLLSGLLLFALFFPREPVESRWRAVLGIAVGMIAAVAVAAGALHQLGPFRLGLADTTLRDALVAAGGAQLKTMFSAVLLIATVPTVIGLLAAAGSVLRGGAETGKRHAVTRVVVCGVIVAAGAVLLSPAATLLIASVSAVISVLAGWWLGRQRVSVAPGAEATGHSAHSEYTDRSSPA